MSTPPFSGMNPPTARITYSQQDEQAFRAAVSRADAQNLKRQALADLQLFGVNTAPTAEQGTETKQIATTEFVAVGLDLIYDAIDALGGTIATDTDGLPEGLTNLYFTPARAQAAISLTPGGNGLTYSAGVFTSSFGTMATETAANYYTKTAADVLLALKAPLASPALTGTPTAPTAAPGTNTTQLASTAFVEAARVILAAATALKADIASPTFTGDPKAPTPSTADNDTSIATTAYVQANLTAFVGVTHTWAQTQTFTVAPVFTDASGTRTALGLGSLATQSGTFSGTSSGTNTGDQTITLTGQVTGSGTGSFATVLATAQPDVHTWALAQTFTVAPVFTAQSATRTALGLGTAATVNTGTSGGTVPLLNTAPVWSAGSLSVAGTTADQFISLDSSAGQVRAVQFKTAASLRWVISAGSAAESGSNVGSDLRLLAYDDAGSLLGTWLTVARATRVATFDFAPQAPSGIGAQSGPMAANFQPAIVSTTAATVTTLANIPSTASAAIAVIGWVVAYRTGGAAGAAEDSAMFRVEFGLKRVAGAAALVGGAAVVTVIGRDQAAWAVTVDVSGTNARIRVAGAASNNIDWQLSARGVAVA